MGTRVRLAPDAEVYGCLSYDDGDGNLTGTIVQVDEVDSMFLVALSREQYPPHRIPPPLDYLAIFEDNRVIKTWYRGGDLLPVN